MKVLETLLVGLMVTSGDLAFECFTHKQPITVNASFSTGRDKTSAKAVQTKIGYIGMTLVKNAVCEVFPDSPADKAGITAGDKLMEIDAKTTYGLSSAGLADELIGPAGTAVEIIVEHGDELRKLKLVRSEAVPPEAQRVVAEMKQSELVENWTK